MAISDRRNDDDSNPRLRLFRSTDNGTLWTETWAFDSGVGHQQFFPNVVVNPNGQVHVSFAHALTTQPCAYGTNSVATWIATSYDNGLSFTSPRQVSANFSVNSGQILYFDADVTTSLTDDHVFGVWTDHSLGHPAPYFANIDPPPAPPQSIAVVATPPNEFGYRYPKVSWAANTEPDIASYDVWRRIPTGTNYCGNGTWYYLGSSSSSEYIDYSIGTAGMDKQCTALYKLKAKDTQNNLSDFSASAEINYANWQFKRGGGEAPSPQFAPSSYALHGAYPNPFNPSTEIKFDLPEDSRVTLAVYDMLGRKVADLVNANYAAGYHSVTWNAKDVASGVYFTRFTATDANGTLKFSKINKLILNK